MTPEISIRTFTDDQYVLDKVFYANNYRLKNFGEEEKITIVDIGAHIGFFSLLCLMRGADKVYCVEPFTDNFRVMNKNLEAFPDKITALKLGVYTESRFAAFEFPENKDNFFYLSTIEMSKGEDTPSDMSYFITLDELLGGLPETEIDLLKIHIGYAEADILLSSQRIEKCKFICGETKTSENKMKELIDHMKEKGFKDSFFAESKEDEGSHLFLFAKEKCEDLFNLYVSGSPEEEGEATVPQAERMA